MNKTYWRLPAVLAVLALMALSCKAAQEAVDNASPEETPAVLYTADSNLEPMPTSTRRPSATNEPGETEEPAASGAVEAILALDENGKSPTTAFGQGDAVYLVGNLNREQGANLRTAWTAVEAEGNPPDTLIQDFADQPFEPGGFWFRLEWPRPWALGQYRVDLYVDGELDQSLEYEVLETNTSGATIDTTLTTLDEAGLETATTFGAGDTFHLHFNLANAPADTPVKIIWMARQVEGMDPNSYINENTALMNNGANWHSIRQAQPWSAGEYQADLFIDSQLAQTVVFQVASTNPESIALADSYTARDEAGADLSTTFSPTDSIYVHFSLVEAPDDTAVTISMAAVDETGYHTFIDKYRDLFSSGEYYIYFTPDTTWTPGNYVLYLYVNGDPAEQIEIAVQ